MARSAGNGGRSAPDQNAAWWPHLQNELQPRRTRRRQWPVARKTSTCGTVVPDRKLIGDRERYAERQRARSCHRRHVSSRRRTGRPSAPPAAAAAATQARAPRLSGRSTAASASSGLVEPPERTSASLTAFAARAPRLPERRRGGAQDGVASTPDLAAGRADPGARPGYPCAPGGLAAAHQRRRRAREARSTSSRPRRRDRLAPDHERRRLELPRRPGRRAGSHRGAQRRARPPCGRCLDRADTAHEQFGAVGAAQLPGGRGNEEDHGAHRIPRAHRASVLRGSAHGL